MLGEAVDYLTCTSIGNVFSFFFLIHFWVDRKESVQFVPTSKLHLGSLVDILEHILLVRYQCLSPLIIIKYNTIIPLKF